MIQFGTGGWRAVIGSDFIEKNICLVTEGICALMKEEGKTDKPIVVGYDHRFLSDVAAKWMAEVFAVLRAHRLEPKRVALVKNNPGGAPWLFWWRRRKTAKPA